MAWPLRNMRFFTGDYRSKNASNSNVSEAMMNRPYFVALYFINLFCHFMANWGMVYYCFSNSKTLWLTRLSPLPRLSTASVTDETPGQALQVFHHDTERGQWSQWVKPTQQQCSKKYIWGTSKHIGSRSMLSAGVCLSTPSW